MIELLTDGSLNFRDLGSPTAHRQKNPAYENACFKTTRNTYTSHEKDKTWLSSTQTFRCSLPTVTRIIWLMSWFVWFQIPTWLKALFSTGPPFNSKTTKLMKFTWYSYGFNLQAAQRAQIYTEICVTTPAIKRCNYIPQNQQWSPLFRSFQHF